MKAPLRPLILSLFLLTGCLSCTREAPFTPVECQYFVSETFSRTITFEDVFNSIKAESEAGSSEISETMLIVQEAGADVTYIVADDVTHREMYFVMCKDFIENAL